jgi:hypothetical protein
MWPVRRALRQSATRLEPDHHASPSNGEGATSESNWHSQNTHCTQLKERSAQSLGLAASVDNKQSSCPENCCFVRLCPDQGSKLDATTLMFVSLLGMKITGCAARYMFVSRILYN